MKVPEVRLARFGHASTFVEHGRRKAKFGLAVFPEPFVAALDQVLIICTQNN
jgi:hypothetical protein